MKRIAVVEDEVYMREELCDMLQTVTQIFLAGRHTASHGGCRKKRLILQF